MRSDPILAVAAVQIASQHSEAVRQSARIGVKKRLLLDGIALDPADVSPRHIESTAAVVAHFADSGLPLRDGAAMAAGITAHPIAIELLIQVAFAHLLVDDIAERGHR